ncbi:MAG: hypothetical protein L0216_02775 [Planctomycetales bacterium]|nr:hypothetical protein [Planctomycetales bacterium]
MRTPAPALSLAVALATAAAGCVRDGGRGAGAATPPSAPGTPSASLLAGRYAHSATLLASGRVLVAGGAGAGWTLHSSAEVYDPASAAWTATGSLAAARARHATVALADGRVLALLGYPGGLGVGNCEIYDPSTGSWTTAAPLTVPWGTAALCPDLVGFTATRLSAGRVLVAGGFWRYATYAASPSLTLSVADGYFGMGAVTIYDPSTGTWSRSGALLTDRQGHTATLLADGKVLVAGGDVLGPGAVVAYLPNGGFLASAELYDPSTGTWTATGGLATARSGASATRLSDGRVLVAGGASATANPLFPGVWFPTTLASAEVYDPATGTWSAAGSMNAARSGHFATLLASGKAYVLDASAGETYDPAAGTWTASVSPAVPRPGAAAVRLRDGSVLVTGGLTAVPGGTPVPLATAEVLRP